MDWIARGSSVNVSRTTEALSCPRIWGTLKRVVPRASDAMCQ